MTVRIDTLRNRIAGTRQLLEMLAEELDDLHLLAYERPAAKDEAHVAGGSRDYALDTHGDPQCRAAYRRLGDVTADACARIDASITDALQLLRQGSPPTRTGRRLHLVELGEAIAAQTRRAARGDYTAVRRGPQPDERRALADVVDDRDRLTRELAAAHKEIARLTIERRSRRDRPSTSRAQQVR
jgi:hypothetical protein